MTGVFLCMICIALCAWAVTGDSVEKALEETIRSSLSLDFNLYNEDEDLYVLIINQEGYEICKGMASWQRVDQIRCTFSTDILSPGINKFDITVYSPKNRVLVLKSTVDFNYEPKPASSFSQAIGAVKDTVLCRGGKCYNTAVGREGKRDPLKKLFIVSGVVAVLGVFESIVFGQVLRAFQSFAAIFRPKQQAPLPVIEIAPPSDPSPPPAPDSNPDHFPPPDMPSRDLSYPPSASAQFTTRPPSRMSAVLQNAKRNMRGVTVSRSVKLAVFVCALALMHQDTVRSILAKGLSGNVIPTRTVTSLTPSASASAQKGQNKVPVNANPSSVPPPAIYQVSPSVRRQLEQRIAQDDFKQKQKQQQEQPQQQRQEKSLVSPRTEVSFVGKVKNPQKAPVKVAVRTKPAHWFYKHVILHTIMHHIPEFSKHVTIRNAARLVNEGIVPRWTAIQRMFRWK